VPLQSVGVAVGHAHLPYTHPLPPVHLLPQAPQLVGSDWRLTHTVPQQTCAVGHPQGLHLPALHVDPVKQALPHVPQFKVSLLVLTHLPAQLVSPRMQEHAPVMQVNPAVVSHLVPQVPQLLLSLFTSTHAPQSGGIPSPQKINGPPHPGGTHFAFMQYSPLQQCLPHVPQLYGSLLRLTHFPTHSV